MIGISPKLTLKRILIGIPIILIGLFFLISAIGWLRDWRENPLLAKQNEQRAQELRMRVVNFPESMPVDQFLKEFPEAVLDPEAQENLKGISEINMDPETQFYKISIPDRFQADSPTWSGSFSIYYFEVNKGNVVRGKKAWIIVCGGTVKGVLYYFFRAWSSQEDFDYRKE